MFFLSLQTMQPRDLLTDSLAKFTFLLTQRIFFFLPYSPLLSFLETTCIENLFHYFSIITCTVSKDFGLFFASINSPYSVLINTNNILQLYVDFA
jgi:hypothetical protein